MSRNPASERDELSQRGRMRKLRPGFDAQNGTHFPLEPLVESVSRNSAPEWDALSGWSFKRKVHSGIRAWNGTHDCPCPHPTIFGMRVSALLCIRQAAAFGGSPGLRIAWDVDATDKRVGALVDRITKDRFIEIGELTAMAHTIVVA